MNKKTYQQYQPGSFQRLKNVSPSYMKENCIGYGLDNNKVREVLMQHDGILEAWPFMVPLFIKKMATREHIFYNNHNNVSRPKDLKNNTDTSNSGPPKETFLMHKPKVN